MAEEWEQGESPSFKRWDDLMVALVRRDQPHLLYRGQSDFDWPLACSLSRALRTQAAAGGPIPLDLMESMVVDEDLNRHVEFVETQLLRTFIDKALGLGIPNLPPANDRLAWWELMQHHGVPTRLMDWTRSPFIGLWFALRLAVAQEGDAAIWIFDSRNSLINYFAAMAEDTSPGWVGFQDDRAWQNGLAERAISARMIVPLIVSPRMDVPRVVAQQSAMTLIPNIQMPTGFGHSVFASLTTKVRIPLAWAQEVLRTCEMLGITRFELFRDLDSVGELLTSSLSTNQPISTVDTALHLAQSKWGSTRE